MQSWGGMQFLDQLFIVSADPSVLVLSNYDPLLVVMSLCIAVFTSGMALQLAGVARDRKNETKTRMFGHSHAKIWGCANR